MDRGTMGKTSGRAGQRLGASFPCSGPLRYFQINTSPLFNTRGTLRCRAIFQSQYWWNQGLGESLLDMFIWRIMTALAASALVCGGTTLAAAQGAPSKAAKVAPKVEAKPAIPAVAGAEPTLIGQFGTWGAYTATANGKKVCFALAKPSSSKTNPPNRPRDPAYAFVSTRPAEKVINEVSVMIGYALKPGSESTLEVGGAAYAMYTQGDGLWIKNAAEEERMVEAMRRSADVVVKGVSAKGTETTDTFSMKGLSQALDKIGQDCRR
jgi:invasion associated locus B (IalB) protein